MFDVSFRRETRRGDRASGARHTHTHTLKHTHTYTKKKLLTRPHRGKRKRMYIENDDARPSAQRTEANDRHYSNTIDFISLNSHVMCSIFVCAFVWPLCEHKSDEHARVRREGSVALNAWLTDVICFFRRLWTCNVCSSPRATKNERREIEGGNGIETRRRREKWGKERKRKKRKENERESRLESIQLLSKTKYQVRSALSNCTYARFRETRVCDFLFLFITR